MIQKISAKIVADSISPHGNRISSLLCVMPRFILSEINTHRLFSRNSASSRAVPFKIMTNRVLEDPFTPIAWQKDHNGMQGTEYIDIDGNDAIYPPADWLEARDYMVGIAQELNADGVTKQLCNRLLEPFMWHQALITATEWRNFFTLRSPIYRWSKDMIDLNTYRSKKDVLAAMKEAGVNTSHIEAAPIHQWLQQNSGGAEIHLSLACEAIWDAMNESKPKELKPGEWHIPFGDDIDENRLANLVYGSEPKETWFDPLGITHYKVKIATARCARTSYINYEGKDDYAADLKLFDNLSKQEHWSPFEHCAKCMTKDEYAAFTHTIPIRRNGAVIGQSIDEGWCRNFKGFIQLRAIMEGEV